MLSHSYASSQLLAMSLRLVEIDAAALAKANVVRECLKGSDLQPYRTAIANARRAHIATELRKAEAEDDAWTLVEKRVNNGQYRFEVGDDLLVQFSRQSPGIGGGKRSLPGAEPLFADDEIFRTERSVLHLRAWFTSRDEGVLDFAHFQRVGKKKFTLQWSLLVADIAKSATVEMPAPAAPPRTGMQLKQPARKQNDAQAS